MLKFRKVVININLKNKKANLNKIVVEFNKNLKNELKMKLSCCFKKYFMKNFLEVEKKKKFIKIFFRGSYC